MKGSTSERILRQDELLDRVGLRRTTIWRLEKNGDFPKRRKLHGNAVGWLESEVVEWMEGRPCAGASVVPQAYA